MGKRKERKGKGKVGSKEGEKRGVKEKEGEYVMKNEKWDKRGK